MKWYDVSVGNRNTTLQFIFISSSYGDRASPLFIYLFIYSTYFVIPLFFLLSGLESDTFLSETGSSAWNFVCDFIIVIWILWNTVISKTVFQDGLCTWSELSLYSIFLLNGLYTYTVLNALFCMYGPSLCYCVSVGLFWALLVV